MDVKVRPTDPFNKLEAMEVRLFFDSWEWASLTEEIRTHLMGKADEFNRAIDSDNYCLIFRCVKEGDSEYFGRNFIYGKNGAPQWISNK